jgi:hypothetical protein
MNQTSLTKVTNQERIQLHKAWWRRENIQRLALIYAPAHFPYGGLDVDVPLDQIAMRKRRNAEAQYTQPKDVLVTAYVDFATALIPAMLGTGFEYDPQTSWAIPAVSSILEVEIPPFDPEQPLFQAYIQRVQRVLDEWSWESYLPANYAYLGPVDVLAGILGPERLALELYEHPSHVKGKALEAAQFLVDMAQYELNLFRQAGIQDGTPCAFNYWLPGDGYLYSEDFCALVSRKHYEQFFLEADIAFNQPFDSAFLHVHSAGFQCLPAILDNPYLKGLELANDINNRDITKLVAAGRLVQERGLPVQVSSWEHPLTETETKLLLDSLDPKGLILALQARSADEGQQFYRLVKDYPL